ncbi:histone-lysine N-methyltransferase SETMAR [Trichonephila clavipes]|nr:histone-lysine N-methyltransferase SETMAR [Trichonephila clavipes]
MRCPFAPLFRHSQIYPSPEFLFIRRIALLQTERDLYCQQLDRLKLAKDQKWPKLDNRTGIVFHQDNARPHTSVVTRQILWEFGLEVLRHLPYSLDLVPSDYHLFFTWQNFLSDKKLGSREDCENRLLDVFANKGQDFYERSIVKLLLKWQQIIQHNGVYLSQIGKSEEIKLLKQEYFNLPDDTDLKDALDILIDLQAETQELERGAAFSIFVRGGKTATAGLERENFPKAADIVLHDVYLDDILSGCSSLNELESLNTELAQLFKSAGMSLHKWCFSHATNDFPDLHFDQSSEEKNLESIILYGFSDASEKGFGAVTYVSAIKNNGDRHSQLLCSKSRVAPLKTLAIPRLELSAYLLLSKLVRKVTNALKMNLSQVILFSDSTIALSWIKTPPPLLKTFVANRVAKIQELTVNFSWHHISSENNPADLVSRDLNVSDLITFPLWWKSPDPSIFSNDELLENINDCEVKRNLKFLHPKTYCSPVLHASIVISEKRNNDGPVRVRKRYDCGMRCTGCSVTETAIYLGRARSTVSAVMTAYKKCGNVMSGKHNSGRKRKLTDRDKRVLIRIVA